MSEDKQLDEHVATMEPAATLDARRARTISGVRCSMCRRHAPDVDLIGERCGDEKCSGYWQAVERTELRVKNCARCNEQFLWKFNYRDAELALEHAQSADYKRRVLSGPDNCRACEEEAGAAYKYQAAKRQYEKAKKVRIEQRAAVARFKPKDSAR